MVGQKRWSTRLKEREFSRRKMGWSKKTAPVIFWKRNTSLMSTKFHRLDIFFVFRNLKAGNFPAFLFWIFKCERPESIWIPAYCHGCFFTGLAFFPARSLFHSEKVQHSRCKWHPVTPTTCPVFPTKPICCPRDTLSPVATYLVLRWA